MVTNDWILDIFFQIRTIFDLFRLAFDINCLNLNQIVVTIKSDCWNQIEKVDLKMIQIPFKKNFAFRLINRISLP